MSYRDPKEQGYKIPYDHRKGLRGTPPFDGMDKDSDRGSIADNGFEHLENFRLSDAGVPVSRPGRIKGINDPIDGCVELIFDAGDIGANALAGDGDEGSPVRIYTNSEGSVESIDDVLFYTDVKSTWLWRADPSSQLTQPEVQVGPPSPSLFLNLFDEIESVVDPPAPYAGPYPLFNCYGTYLTRFGSELYVGVTAGAIGPFVRVYLARFHPITAGWVFENEFYYDYEWPKSDNYNGCVIVESQGDLYAGWNNHDDPNIPADFNTGRELLRKRGGGSWATVPDMTPTGHKSFSFVAGADFGGVCYMGGWALLTPGGIRQAKILSITGTTVAIARAVALGGYDHSLVTYMYVYGGALYYLWTGYNASFIPQATHLGQFDGFTWTDQYISDVGVSGMIEFGGQLHFQRGGANPVTEILKTVGGIVLDPWVSAGYNPGGYGPAGQGVPCRSIAKL